MLGGSCASATGEIKAVLKTAKLIIADDKAKIAGLILITVFIFTQPEIAAIWF